MHQVQITLPTTANSTASTLAWRPGLQLGTVIPLPARGLFWTHLGARPASQVLTFPEVGVIWAIMGQTCHTRHGKLKERHAERDRTCARAYTRRSYAVATPGSTIFAPALRCHEAIALPLLPDQEASPTQAEGSPILKRGRSPGSANDGTTW